MTKQTPWEAAVWYGTDDKEVTKQFDCYKKKMRNGYIWLRVIKDEYIQAGGVRYEFTCAQGANSQYSYSGCLPPDKNGLTLEQAQEAVYQSVKAQNKW